MITIPPNIFFRISCDANPTAIPKDAEIVMIGLNRRIDYTINNEEKYPRPTKDHHHRNEALDGYPITGTFFCEELQ